MSQPGGDPQLPKFGELASKITRTRNDFGRVYEQVRASIPASRSFLAVGGGAETDQIAFERALRQAHEEGWFAQLGERLIGDGFVPNDSAAATELQAVISVALGFPDASVIEAGGLRARQRLCRIEVARHGGPAAVTGTGFLVGPSTVLTAFHVVADLVDVPQGIVRAGSSADLRVTFDHTSGRRQSVSFRVPESWLVAWSGPHPAELDSADGVQAADLVGALDYAVIGIAGSPGSERGFYRLDRLTTPVVGDAIHLFQHPMGVEQRQTFGVCTGFREQTNEERINHTANAVGGSSGGLLLNGRYDLVGLHQGAIPRTLDSGREVNTGISASAIRDHLAQQGVNLLDSSYVPQFRLADGSRPILGRTSCQGWIRDPKPLVRVKSLADCRGLSFTVEVMRACLPESEHVIGTVVVKDLDSDALATAELLLSRLDVDSTDLPGEASVDSSRGVWLTGLAGEFGARVAAAHPDRTAWLVIDDLEKRYPIPEGSCRDFLSELYKQVPGFPNLRIVLLGLSDYPSGFPTGLAADEEIIGPRQDDISKYVKLRLVAGGVAHSGAEVDRFSLLVVYSAGLEIEQLSNYVADKVDHVLNDVIETVR